MRFEIPGYEILEADRTFQVGARTEWPMTMKASNVPLRIQRLGRSFRF